MAIYPRGFQRDGRIECSELKSQTRQKLYSLIFFTLPTVFQRVDIKEFAYRVDCGNIVCKSCCGQKDAPTVHLLRACLLGRASLPRGIRAVYPVRFKLVMSTFERYC